MRGTQPHDPHPRDASAIHPIVNPSHPPLFFWNIEAASAECVNLFETIFRKKFYAAMGSGGLMNTIGLSAGGSGVPCTKRLGLRAYAA